MMVNGKKETLYYWMAKYRGVQKYAECDHVLPNSCIKNNCKTHLDADSVVTGNCAVELVYLFYADAQDNR